MAPPLITLTRQYASGGSDIAQLVARQLGWTVIDNEFVDEVARRAGLAPAEVAQRDERAPGLLERVARALSVASPEMFITTATVPQVEEDESQHGRVVLVGRGAQALLAQRPDALHVYVVASKPWRMRLAVERLGADPAQAEKAVDDVDRQRDRYVKTYYGRARQAPENYDLVVNAERLGFAGAAGVVVADAKRRGWS